MSDRPTPEVPAPEAASAPVPTAPVPTAPTPPEPGAPLAEAPPVAVAVAEPPAPAPAAPVVEVASPAPAPPAPVPSAPVPSAPAAEAPARRGSVQVPVWALVLVTVVVVGLGAFFVGRETAPASGDSGPRTLAEAVEETAAGELEVGDFDVRTLLQALAQNDDLNLGALGDLILGQGGRN